MIIVYITLNNDSEAREIRIEKIVKDSIDYTNCIAEIPVGRQRLEFLDWMNKETQPK